MKVEQPDSRPELKCIPLNEVERREIDWLWKDRIPKGAITLLEGEGGKGKSTIIAELCSRLSSGVALPEDVAKSSQNILLLAAEDDPACVLRPRFETHGADLARVLFDDQAMLLNESGIDALTRAIHLHRIDVVVIDPIVAFLGQKIDMNKGNDVRSVLGPLAKLGRDTGCTFIVVRHFNKSRDGAASQRGAGSVDFRNAARSVLQVIHSQEESFLALEKSNYAARARTLKFAVVNGRIEWQGHSDLSADQLHSEGQASSESKTSMEEAVDFLEIELRSGPKPAKELTRLAGDNGISDKTLQRAKVRLGIKSLKCPHGWVWSLSTKGDAVEHGQDGQERQAGNVDHLGHLEIGKQMEVTFL